MVLLHTPVCEFGKPAVDFSLPDVDGNTVSLTSCAGPKGLLIMFICNHCPYVKAIQAALVEDTKKMMAIGIYSVAIMSNDTTQYPEDSLENMKRVAEEFDFPFPYLLDETQVVGKAYGAVCTPDFFGYNADLALQYRGRFSDNGANLPVPGSEHSLLIAMEQIAKTGYGPKKQMPSMGCSIKW